MMFWYGNAINGWGYGLMITNGASPQLALSRSSFGGGPSAADGPVHKDFGIDIEMPLEDGGVVVGDKSQVTLEIELNQA